MPSSKRNNQGESGSSIVSDDGQGVKSTELQKGKVDLNKSILDALSQIKDLTIKVNSMHKGIMITNNRLYELEEHLSDHSGTENEQDNKSDKKKAKVNRKKDTNKKGMGREARLHKQNIRSSGDIGSSTATDGEAEFQDNTKVAKKKKVKKKKVSRKNDSCMTSSSQDEDSFSNISTSSIGYNCCKKSCVSKKIKSGAFIKKRPVLKAELWPHTVCNEEETEEVDSNSISLTKFFTYFTLIMINYSSKAESLGRTHLLHAVRIVLEYLPWAEARSFHNMLMVKIEQGRLNWSTNFGRLANEFVDKRVRKNLKVGKMVRSQNPYTHNGNCYRYGNISNPNKNGNMFFNKNISDKSKSLSALICYQ